MKVFCIEECEKICTNCKHYVQHWIQHREEVKIFVPCYSGHCTYPRLKTRKPDDTCEHFEKKD